MVDQVGPTVQACAWGGDRRTGRGNFGMYMGRLIVANGEFVTLLCESIEVLFGVVSGVRSRNGM